jgi:hypothetical protein
LLSAELLRPEVGFHGVSPDNDRLNIEHYRRLLKTETDESKRQTIAKLLAEEETKLAKLSAREE